MTWRRWHDLHRDIRDCAGLVCLYGVAAVSAIRRSARGMPCQVRIPAVCNHDPATTVWAHANGISIGKGIGMKANDLLGAYACFACHSCYDLKRPPEGWTMTDVENAFWEGHARSLVILNERDLVRTA